MVLVLQWLHVLFGIFWFGSQMYLDSSVRPAIAQLPVDGQAIMGRGLGQGIHKIHYLPEAHTDMIFAVIGEELGLVGAALVMAGYAAFGLWYGAYLVAVWKFAI